MAPVLSEGRGGAAPRKAADGFLHHRDRNHDIVAPILRPKLDSADLSAYHRICRHLKVDPDMRDNDSYMQIIDYKQFAYLQVRSGSLYVLSLQLRRGS